MHPAAPGPRRRRRASRLEEVPATAREILALAGRLLADRVELVVMEATSDYWRIWFYLLEAAGLTVQLVNPAHARQLAGRPKTDRLDAQWIARLAEMGLLRPSFVPPPEIRALRDLTRTRVQLVRDRTREWQRLEKLLEGALVKLSSVVSRLARAKTARDILEALADGQRDPKTLAAMAAGQIKGGRAAVEQALEGMLPGEHHPMLIRIHLDHITFLDRSIAAVEDQIERRPGRDPRRLGNQRRRRPVPGPRPRRRGADRGGAARGDPRRQPEARHGDHRRDRPGYDPVPDGGPPGLLGRPRPGRPPVRPPQPQAEERPGRRLPQGLLHPGRQRRRPHRAPSSANGSAASASASAASGPSARSAAPSSSSSGTCSPTPKPGSATSDPTGTSARPTATARSAPTSASSRPSASTSPSPPPPKTRRPRSPGPLPKAPRAVKPCPRLVADSHGQQRVAGSNPAGRTHRNSRSAPSGADQLLMLTKRYPAVVPVACPMPWSLTVPDPGPRACSARQR